MNLDNFFSNIDFNLEDKLFVENLLLSFDFDTNPNFKTKIPNNFLRLLVKKRAPIEVFRQYFPSNLEKDTKLQKQGFIDPIGDQKKFKASQLIHRYKSKVLFLPTNYCPINCRFCFRKNELSDLDFENKMFKSDFKESESYLRENPNIKEVIFSGGDPLVLGISKLEYYLAELSKIKTIKFLRFHSRVPLFSDIPHLKKYMNLLQSYQNRFHISLVIHVNHPFEVSNCLDMEKVYMLLDGFDQILSQSVLLKGVNNNEEILTELFESLSLLKIKPYYLHHPDLTFGAMHFYLDQSSGLEILKKVQNNLPGWMIPKYIMDNPEAIGKVQIGF
jgi:lysine 2,3-aminomutase